METSKKRRMQKQLSKPGYKKKWKKYINNYLSVQGELPSPELVHKMCTLMKDKDNSDMVKRPKIEPELDSLLEKSNGKDTSSKDSETSSDDTDDECQNGEKSDKKSAKHNDDDNASRDEDNSNDDAHTNDDARNNKEGHNDVSHNGSNDDKGSNDEKNDDDKENDDDEENDDDKENDDDEENDDDDDDVEKDADNDAESSSSSSNDENEESSDTKNIDDMNRILSFKAGTNAIDILTSVSALAVKQGLPLAATLDILKIFNLISTEVQVPTTETGFIEAVSRKDDPPIECHTYCCKCQTVIDFATTPIMDFIKCGTCGPVEPKRTNPFFIKANIKSQLKTILAIPGIEEQLQYRFNRKKNQEDGIEDIYDGIEYKRLSEPGNFLHYKWNYSFTVHIDFCQKARVPSKAWPVLLTINELPPQLRKRHVVLAGIWVNETSVKLETYLARIFDELWVLSSSGITWKPDGLNVLTSKFTPLICLVGAELRPDLLNMNKSHEPFACSTCYTEGKMLSNQRVYPADEKHRRRTDKELRQHMADATLSGEPVMGVKGDSVAMRIPNFDLVCGTVVDSMDVIFMGVAKELVKLFISGPTTNPWYRGDRKSLKKINAFDLNRTGSIGRSEKTIESYESWDATDWKHWLLYYSVPSFFSVVRRTDHNLLVTLSDAAHLVSGNTLTPDELKTARKLIQKFIHGFQSAFGEAKMSFNLHLLEHLADTIDNWGPLWVHSSYPFKSYNKESIKLVSSRKADALQLCRGYFLRMFIENISNNSAVTDTTKKNVLDILNWGKEGSPEFYLRKGDFRDFHGIGPTKRSTRVQFAWQTKLLKDLGIKSATKFTQFKQALIKGIKYSCKDYSQTTGYSFDEDELEYPTMLYTKKHDLGEIISIVSFIDVNGTTVNGVFVQFMCDAEKRFNAAHIRQLKETRDRGFILVDDVLAPAIVLTIYDLRYVARLAIPWE